MSANHNLKTIEAEVSMLSQDDQLRLLERLAHRLRTGGVTSRKRTGWSEMYGVAASSPIGMDAQEYVNQLREDR